MPSAHAAGPRSGPTRKRGPRRAWGPTGAKREWELATLSSPCAGIGRPWGCRLPDAILHGKRSCRPHSRAVQRFAAAGFRVRPLGPLSPAVAPPACGPGEDTPASTFPRLHHLLRDGHRGWRCVGPKPRVWPLISQAAFRSQAGGACYLASPAFRKVVTRPAWTRCPSRRRPSLCPAFRRFWFGRLPSLEPPEWPAPCWYAVAAMHPLGDSDSPGSETNPDYLTRLRAASDRSSPHSPCFASLTARERRQRNW